MKQYILKINILKLCEDHIKKLGDMTALDYLSIISEGQSKSLLD